MNVGRVCFISSTARQQRPLLDGSTRYRCYHVAEGMAAEGRSCAVTTLQTFLGDPSFDFDLYVFHRPTTAQPRFRAVLDSLKRAGKSLVADYDDLIFGPPALALQSSIYKNGHCTEQQALTLFENNLAAMQAFQFVTTSTQPLAERAREFHPAARVAIVPNSMSSRVLALYDVLGRRAARGTREMVGYFAGTRSHDHDFPIAEEAVLALLDENPALKFLVVGPVRLNQAVRDHPRVLHHEVVDYWQLFELMTYCHTSIAPLEETNFNACKSNVKFLEACVVGCRLVASPIPDMERMAESGCAITLPRSPTEWLGSLSERVRDGFNSHADAVNRAWLSTHGTSRISAGALLSALEH